MVHDSEVCAVQVARSAAGSVIEIHLCVPPDGGAEDFDAQAASLYARLRVALRSSGLEPRDVVAEKVFLSDVGAQAPRLRALRREIYGDDDGALHPATTYVGDPPALAGRLCELQALALRAAGGGPLPSRAVQGLPDGASGRIVDEDGMRHIVLAGLTGGVVGDRLDFEGQAAAMFRSAAAALALEGAGFQQVARTWIYIADIDRHYASFNRARRAFLSGQGIVAPPASTAIRGVPFPPDRGCALDLRAFAGSGPLRVTPFRVPAMNEAALYGSDFSRAVRVGLAGRALIFISGTASIDADGAVVHAGDIEGQVGRMLKNTEALLGAQGAGYSDVLSAVTYLKERAFLDPFRRIAARRGLPASTPNTICVADICRPGWLCEIEVTAALPRD